MQEAQRIGHGIIVLAVGLMAVLAVPDAAAADLAGGEETCGDCETIEDSYVCGPGGALCHSIEHEFPGGEGCGFPWPWQDCLECSGTFHGCHTEPLPYACDEFHDECGGGGQSAAEAEAIFYALAARDYDTIARAVVEQRAEFNRSRRVVQIMSTCSEEAVAYTIALSADAAVRLESVAEIALTDMP